jgi:hypothetical protein
VLSAADPQGCSGTTLSTLTASRTRQCILLPPPASYQRLHWQADHGENGEHSCEIGIPESCWPVKLASPCSARPCLPVMKLVAISVVPRQSPESPWLGGMGWMTLTCFLRRWSPGSYHRSASSVVAVTWSLPAQLVSCVGPWGGEGGKVTCGELSAASYL